MCGRFTLSTTDPARIRARFGLEESAKVSEEPRYNIAPTDPVLAIRLTGDGNREAGRLRWGLVPGRVRRVVSRAALPDPGRWLLRVARRRPGEDARVGQPLRR